MILGSLPQERQITLFDAVQGDEILKGRML